MEAKKLDAYVVIKRNGGAFWAISASIKGLTPVYGYGSSPRTKGESHQKGLVLPQAILLNHRHFYQFPQ